MFNAFRFMCKEKDKRKYQARIWNEKSNGQKVSISAKNLFEAKKILLEKYGKGNVFCLHDPLEADKPR